MSQWVPPSNFNNRLSPTSEDIDLNADPQYDLPTLNSQMSTERVVVQCISKNTSIMNCGFSKGKALSLLLFPEEREDAHILKVTEPLNGLE